MALICGKLICGINMWRINMWRINMWQINMWHINMWQTNMWHRPPHVVPFYKSKKGPLGVETLKRRCRFGELQNASIVLAPTALILKKSATRGPKQGYVIALFALLTFRILCVDKIGSRAAAACIISTTTTTTTTTTTKISAQGRLQNVDFTSPCSFSLRNPQRLSFGKNHKF